MIKLMLSRTAKLAAVACLPVTATTRLRGAIQQWEAQVS